MPTIFLSKLSHPWHPLLYHALLLFIRTHMKTNSLAVLLVLRVIDPFQCSLLKHPSVSCPPHPVHQSMSVPAASHPHLTWLKSAALHPGLLGSIELQDIAVGIKLNTQCCTSNLHAESIWCDSLNTWTQSSPFGGGVEGGWVGCGGVCICWPKGVFVIRSLVHLWLLRVTAGEYKWSEGSNFPSGAGYLIG